MLDEVGVSRRLKGTRYCAVGRLKPTKVSEEGAAQGEKKPNQKVEQVLTLLTGQEV